MTVGDVSRLASAGEPADLGLYLGVGLTLVIAVVSLSPLFSSRPVSLPCCDRRDRSLRRLCWDGTSSALRGQQWRSSDSSAGFC